MQYDVYHDESKEAGYWHGILLVPRATRAQFLQLLEEIRTNTRYHHPVTLKRIRDARGPQFRCTQAWMSLAVASLAQRFKGTAQHYLSGRRTPGAPNPEFTALKEPIRARFILSRVRDGHAGMGKYPDAAAQVETTFWMGLKGGLHLFAGQGAQLEVRSFHFDGYEHYQRRVDANRIAGRLVGLREGVSLSPHLVLDDAPGDHRRDGCQSYDDCQFLQLADLLVGGFRTALGIARSEGQRRMAEPLRILAEKWNDGPARMRHSRWQGGFCVSQCYLERDEWVFSDIRPRDEGKQPKLVGL